MFKKLAIFLSLLFSLTGCSQNEYSQLKISATTWVGYSPLFYAKEKGWLDDLNIKLLHVVSLSENMYLFEAGNADAYVGTQYEYSLLIEKDPSLMPVMLFDRSYGGDIILSNVSLAELQNTSETIDAYLEMDSINSTLLKDFIPHYGLEGKKIQYINRDQATLSSLKAGELSRPSLLVTYTPYDIQLEKQGFAEVASTKDGLNLLVVDALFTRESSLNKHRKQFEELKKLVNKATEALKQNPQEFYTTIKPYMLELSYEEFVQSLDSIVWINSGISPELEERIQELGFPIRGLI
ncbi:ABC transporter substrate-binding protein [Thiomicrorhabdus sediminis]|uniref:ABC transporter substrate-binding protein n=1 Tax=Thiomicrorhabdus sediminis TaxID=2580412 RepID=UPI00143D6910|nr:ABC transporter substrate-binding protein [Thiomicrorhabdus sediminis]